MSGERWWRVSGVLVLALALISESVLGWVGGGDAGYGAARRRGDRVTCLQLWARSAMPRAGHATAPQGHRGMYKIHTPNPTISRLARIAPHPASRRHSPTAPVPSDVRTCHDLEGNGNGGRLGRDRHGNAAPETGGWRHPPIEPHLTPVEPSRAQPLLGQGGRAGARGARCGEAGAERGKGAGRG